MKFVLIKGDPKKSIFEQNPFLEYENLSRRLIEELGKIEASKILWAAYMVKDVRSTFRSRPEEERKIIVAKNYLLNPDFDWDYFSYVLEEYPQMAMSPLAKNYLEVEESFKSFVSSMNDPDVVLKPAEKTAFFKSLKPMYESVKFVGEDLDKEYESDEQMRGGQESGFLGRIMEAGKA